MKNKKSILIFLLAFLAIGSGFIFQKMNVQNNISPTNSLFTIALTDQNKEIITLDKYKNKWLIVNFWATWCAPCREEIPELNKFYTQNNIELIGLAIDEIEDVIEFQKKIPIDYPSYIVKEIEGVSLSKQLGNDRGILPFTLIIQPNGVIKKTFYGKLKISDLNQALSDNHIY